MNIKIDNKRRIQIEKEISDENSPVGINAKETHIIIINKLIEIEKRLEKLENKDNEITELKQIDRGLADIEKRERFVFLKKSG